MIQKFIRVTFKAFTVLNPHAAKYQALVLAASAVAGVLLGDTFNPIFQEVCK